MACQPALDQRVPRQRVVHIALALLVLLFVGSSAPQAAAAQSAPRLQNAPTRVLRAVTRVVETLSNGASRAVSAFAGEAPELQQAVVEREQLTGVQRTKRALTAVAAVASVGFIIAFVVLVSAQEPLEAVARAAERDVSRSFWVGVGWQLLAIPIVLVLSVLLAVTIILIPAIPIAMLAWALAYSGAFTLGLFAVALVLGRAITGRSTTHDKRALLTGLITGLVVLLIVWLAAASVVSVPMLGILARLVALALTWVAATVGLGAVVRSRVGTRQEHVEVTTESAIPSWQTPTPVFGVVAARRPTPVSSSTPE